MKILGLNLRWPTWQKPPTMPLADKPVDGKGAMIPGRVSVANDSEMTVIAGLKDMAKLVTPSFRTELIPLIRQLYKVNPDMSIALQDMFKLSNTGHKITFPNNSDEESLKMAEHIAKAQKRWSNYTAGIDGLVNKFIVQCLVGGAMSIEAVPNANLNGVATILFINPEDVMFERLADGVYHPYQINKSMGLMQSNSPLNKQFIKLNTETYKYVAMFNDTDEPYGVPPFLAVLDSLKTQADMKANLKQIMELMGLLGFLEATMDKPDKLASESDATYKKRLTAQLAQMKRNLRDGLKDGVVVGYTDDHTFKLNSTTKNLGGIDKVWSLNQQSVANGLGIASSLIGVQSSNSEGGAGIILSKLIAQLKNIQMLAISVLDFIYTLELRLAGFNNKGMVIEFASSTVSDEVKVQQALEYKLRNLKALYDQGIISQDDYAQAAGYIKAVMKKPRPVPVTKVPGAPGAATSPTDAAKKKRTTGKVDSARKGRDKVKVVPKRKDQKKQ